MIQVQKQNERELLCFSGFIWFSENSKISFFNTCERNFILNRFDKNFAFVFSTSPTSRIKFSLKNFSPLFSFTNFVKPILIIKGIFCHKPYNKSIYLNLSFLNFNSESQILELLGICVKEFAKYSFCSPKFFPTEKTFLNANIKSNSKGGSKWRNMRNNSG